MSFFDGGSKQYWIQKTLLNGERSIQQTIAAGKAQDRAIFAEKQTQETNQNLNLAHHHIVQLQNEVEDCVTKNQQLFKEGMEYKQQTEYYKNLLAKPMIEIAEENKDFKAAYEAQMELLADWMVSQKAFKELAIQFGIEKGLTPDEVIQMGTDKKIDVLNDKHDSSHNTNVGESSFIKPRVEQLKKKLNK